MQKIDLVKLVIGRLESATGPDRETDAYIHCLKHGYQFVRYERWNEHAGRLYYKIPGITSEWALDGAARFTGSFDAAVTLLPDGWFWEAAQNPVFAKVWREGNRAYWMPRQPEEKRPATPTLAICIGAIQAIEESVA
jgi:hypothetical protein